MSSQESAPATAERRNFLVYVGSHGLTRLGDALMNPKTTLSWLGAELGAPTFLIALLVPVREAGSLLLQVAVAGWVDRLSQRKWAWVSGCVVQAGSVAGMAAVGMAFKGWAAGLALLGLVAVFALARSVSSLASKDVMGRSLPSQRRGRAGGWAAGAAGVAILAVAGGGLLWGGDDLRSMAWVLGGAALAWLLAAALFATIDEPRADNTRPRAALRRLALLRQDRRLARFVLVRSLLLCSALSAPYYVILAQRHLSQSGQGWLGFVLLSGLAALLGGPVWGRLADRSSRQVMAVAAGLAAAIGLLVCLLERWHAESLSRPWLLPAAFLLLSLAHQGVRIGRKTWVVNIAEGRRRRDYVAVGNSAMGVLLLLVGGGTALLAGYSLAAALLLLSLLGGAGSLLARRLPDAETGSR